MERLFTFFTKEAPKDDVELIESEEECSNSSQQEYEEEEESSSSLSSSEYLFSSSESSYSTSLAKRSKSSSVLSPQLKCSSECHSARISERSVSLANSRNRSDKIVYPTSASKKTETALSTQTRRKAEMPLINSTYNSKLNKFKSEQINHSCHERSQSYINDINPESQFKLICSRGKKQQQQQEFNSLDQSCEAFSEERSNYCTSLHRRHRDKRYLNKSTSCKSCPSSLMPQSGSFSDLEKTSNFSGCKVMRCERKLKNNNNSFNSLLVSTPASKNNCICNQTKSLQAGTHRKHHYLNTEKLLPSSHSLCVQEFHDNCCESRLLQPSLHYSCAINSRIRKPVNLLIIGTPQCGKSSFINTYRECVAYHGKWPPAPVGMCGDINNNNNNNNNNNIGYMGGRVGSGTIKVEPYPDCVNNPSWLCIDTPGAWYEVCTNRKAHDLSASVQEIINNEQLRSNQAKQTEVENCWTITSTSSARDVILDKLLDGIPWHVQLLGPNKINEKQIANLPRIEVNKPDQCIVVISATELIKDLGWMQRLLMRARYVELYNRINEFTYQHTANISREESNLVKCTEETKKDSLLIEKKKTLEMEEEEEESEEISNYPARVAAKIARCKNQEEELQKSFEIQEGIQRGLPFIEYLQHLISYIRYATYDHIPFIVITKMDCVGGVRCTEARKIIAKMLSKCISSNHIYFISNGTPIDNVIPYYSENGFDLDSYTREECIRLHQHLSLSLLWQMQVNAASYKYSKRQLR